MIAIVYDEKKLKEEAKNILYNKVKILPHMKGIAMKKVYFLFLFIIIFTLLTGCNKYNKNTIQTETTYDNNSLLNKNYQYGVHWTNTFQNNKCNAVCEIDNTGDAVPIGLLAFVNGIPQQYKDFEGNDTYMSKINIDSNENQSSEISFMPVSNLSSNNSVVRYVSMLRPDIFRTNDISYQLGFLHSIMSSYPSTYEIEYNSINPDIDVSDYEGEITNTCINSYFESFTDGNNKSMVNYKPDFTGTFELELASKSSESYIISFWGDHKPIQIGSHMYYNVKINEKEVKKLSFDIKEDDIEGISNFYAIACPVSNDKNNIILKSHTLILSDEELINSYEEQLESEDQTSSYYEVDDYTYEKKISCGKYIYTIINKNQDSIPTTIIQKSLIDSNEIICDYTLKNFVEDNSIKLYSDGVFIKNGENAVILDNSLNEIYSGDICNYFIDNPISSNNEFLSITESECIGFSIGKGVVCKNIKNGRERVLYNSEEDNMCVKDLYIIKDNLIFDGIYLDGRDEIFVCIYNINSGNKKIYDKKVLHQLSGDESSILIDEYTKGNELNKPYVYIYDIESDSMTKINLKDSADVNNSSLSYDGSHIITGSYDEETKQITVTDYTKYSSNVIHTEKATLIYNITQKKDCVIISFMSDEITGIPDFIYKWKG